MARLDRVKNITGLVEWYGKSTKLRELVNLVVAAGFQAAQKFNDKEEMEEIAKMHRLIEKYKLNGQMCWISSQLNRARNGELYRYIADTRGAFVQVITWIPEAFRGIAFVMHFNPPVVSFSLPFMKDLGLLW